MKIKFENVGRSHSTWISEYPIEVPLEKICNDEMWWMQQLRGKMMSTPEWCYNEKERCVDIFAGFHCVGTARCVDEEGEVRQ